MNEKTKEIFKPIQDTLLASVLVLHKMNTNHKRNIDYLRFVKDSNVYAVLRNGQKVLLSDIAHLVLEPHKK
jgi:hypothetical protein